MAAMLTMKTTVQLVGIQGDTAIVRRGEEAPEQVSRDDLRRATRHEQADLRDLYRWLNREAEGCEHTRKCGRSWTPRRRTMAEAIAEIREIDRRTAVERAQREELPRIKAARAEIRDSDPWWPIGSWEVPAGVEFETPRRNQGQIVEVSYGPVIGRSEIDDRKATYMRRVDNGEGGGVSYYRRREIQG